MSRENEARRAAWIHRGTRRPDFAEVPGPGEESVWDYPRPPCLAPEARRVEIRLGSAVVAESRSALRLLETASPPTVYVPPDDVDWSLLRESEGGSHCEWKGLARYWHVESGEKTALNAGWSYPDPYPEYADLADHLAVYPGRLSCFLGGVKVLPQPGEFYGGWVTPEIKGPFKGETGTGGW